MCHSIMMAVSVVLQSVRFILQIVGRGGGDKLRSEQTFERVHGASVFEVSLGETSW